MGDESDVIVRALADRVSQSLESTKHNDSIILALGLSSLSLLIRHRLVKFEDAIEQFKSAVSALPVSDAEDSDQRVEEIIDLLRATLGNSETMGPVVDVDPTDNASQ